MVDRYEERQLKDVVDERHEQNVFGMQLGHVPDRGEVAQTAVIFLDHGRFGPAANTKETRNFNCRLVHLSLAPRCRDARPLSHCFNFDVSNRVLPETCATQELWHHFEQPRYAIQVDQKRPAINGHGHLQIVSGFFQTHPRRFTGETFSYD